MSSMVGSISCSKFDLFFQYPTLFNISSIFQLNFIPRTPLFSPLGEVAIIPPSISCSIFTTNYSIVLHQNNMNNTIGVVLFSFCSIIQIQNTIQHTIGLALIGVKFNKHTKLKLRVEGFASSGKYLWFDIYKQLHMQVLVLNSTIKVYSNQSQILQLMQQTTLYFYWKISPVASF